MKCHFHRYDLESMFYYSFNLKNGVQNNPVPPIFAVINNGILPLCLLAANRSFQIVGRKQVIFKSAYFLLLKEPFQIVITDLIIFYYPFPLSLL